VDDPALLDALAASQRLGMLGPRPVAEVVDHAMAFVAALAGVDGLVVDLGSGGGVPGLVVARARPDLHVVLLDRRATRTDHLQRLVGRLGLDERVRVVTAEAGRARALLDRTADAVIARGFADPATTARAAAPLLRPHGLLVVSGPPDPDDGRWPAPLLAATGFVVVATPDRRVVCLQRDVPRGTSAPN
jgi:16S rRNA (guanine527-N7)-methyltransferase